MDFISYCINVYKFSKGMHIKQYIIIICKMARIAGISEYVVKVQSSIFHFINKYCIIVPPLSSYLCMYFDRMVNNYMVHILRLTAQLPFKMALDTDVQLLRVFWIWKKKPDNSS